MKIERVEGVARSFLLIVIGEGKPLMKLSTNKDFKKE